MTTYEYDIENVLSKGTINNGDMQFKQTSTAILYQTKQH